MILKFYLKLPFLVWTFLFCLGITILIINITSYSNYKIELTSTKAFDFYHATQFDFKIFNWGIHFFLPIILFFIQKEENKCFFSNRMNFYPINKRVFYFTRVLIYYAFSILFSIVIFIVLSFKYTKYHHLGLFTQIQSLLIVKKISFILINGIPYILLINLISFIFQNFIVGIVSHFAFQMMSHFSRSVFFLPSVWPNLTAEFFGQKPMSFTQEFPYLTVITLGVIFTLTIVIWITKIFNNRYYGQI
jgi:hypothetical protein